MTLISPNVCDHPRTNLVCFVEKGDSVSGRHLEQFVGGMLLSKRIWTSALCTGRTRVISRILTNKHLRGYAFETLLKSKSILRWGDGMGVIIYYRNNRWKISFSWRTKTKQKLLSVFNVLAWHSKLLTETRQQSSCRNSHQTHQWQQYTSAMSRQTACNPNNFCLPCWRRKTLPTPHNN